MSLYDSIVQYAVAEESNGQAYNKMLLGVAEGNITTKEELQTYTQTAEDAYMSAFHAEDEAARKKDGSWKYRTYLPAAYSTAKSVIGNALDNGVPLIVGGEARGKTALEKATKEAKALDHADKTPWDEVYTAHNVVLKVWKDLTTAERKVIKVNTAGLED